MTTTEETKQGRKRRAELIHEALIRLKVTARRYGLAHSRTLAAADTTRALGAEAWRIVRALTAVQHAIHAAERKGRAS